MLQVAPSTEVPRGRFSITCSRLRYVGGVWTSTLALAGLLAGPPAQAEAASALDTASRGAVELSWDAPEGCPAAVAVLDQVEEGLGQPLDSVTPVSVRGVVEAGTPWTLVLEVENDAGLSRRSLEGESCEVLADAAALVISISLDPVAIARVRGEGEGGGRAEPGDEVPADPPPVEPSEPMEPAPTAPDRPDPEPEPERPGARGHFAASGGLAAGLLPRVGAAARLDAGVEGRHWQVTAGGDIQPGQQVDVDLDLSGARAVFWSARGVLAGCGVPTHRRLRFPLCVTGGAGVVTGFGRGVENPRLDRQPVFTLGARAEVAWRGRRWIGLFGRFEADAVLRRPGFAFDDLGLVHRSSAVGGTLSLGAHFVFP